MSMTSDVREELERFVTDEMDDGASFEDILEMFDITPGQAFVNLFMSGLVDEETLDSYLTEI